MYRSMATLIVLLATALPAPAAGETFQTDAWRYLPVLGGGRHKPLDTLARDSVWAITGQTSVADPESGQTVEPTALYLEMVLQRQDWGPAADPHVAGGLSELAAYFASHEPDKWDEAPLLPVTNAQLRKALAMDDGQKRISPVELCKAKIEDPESSKRSPFLIWVQSVRPDESGKFGKFQKAARELSERLWSYHILRTAQGLRMMPIRGDKTGRWYSAAALTRLDFDDKSDPSGEMRMVQLHLRDAKAAYLADSPESFNEASDALLATLRELGPKLVDESKDYPTPGIIRLEVGYNTWRPFRVAWIFTLIAAVGLAIGSTNTRWKAVSVAGLVALAVGLGAILIGLVIRWVLKGTPPVTNLYESVVFTALGTAAFGLVFGLWSRRHGILAAAAVVTTIILLLADFCPSVLDPALRPLPPVLRSPEFLVIHVMTIMLGYAALALAVGIGNVTLGTYLLGLHQEETIKVQCRFTYESLKAGVLLLLVGTILGGIWADFSWGRFWGWDKKEVWALITLLAYLIILHARHTNWLGNRGMTAGAVLCFTFVLMAWYGVNFLHGGLHNYGLSGEEGPLWVGSACLLQLAFVGAAIIVSYNRPTAKFD